MGSKWTRVNRQRRCPICGKPDWCLISPDGSAVICARIQSPKRVGDNGAGWWHRIGEPVRRTTVSPRNESRAVVNWQERSDAYERKACVVGIAARLGLKAEALRRLHTGTDGHNITFPMRDEKGRIIGIRLRSETGRKFAVKGSRNGLFMPDRLSDLGDVLVVCEGPTDTAAMLALGFDCIGRPSNTGAQGMLVEFVKIRKPRILALMLDRDAPGSHAESLTRQAAVELASAVDCETRMVKPPVKDARDWITSGASEIVVSSAIANARKL